MTLKPSPQPSGTMNRSIVVAVDYGTTFSGVAWAQSARLTDAQPDIQTTIIQWPDTEGSLEGATSDKVPTELAGHGRNRKWGFGIADDASRHQWFKLGLDPTQESDVVSYLTLNYPDPKALPPSYDSSREAVVLTTDYLRCLRRHTSKILRLRLGDGVVDTTLIRYIITVPAIWDDAAKARTQHCAQSAGMGEDIRVISEPEAAVVHALDALDPHNLIPGDTFVLCDAGGGTVDLISYSVVSLNPKVQIREAVAGSGAACGSTFLNRIFRQYLEKEFGDSEGYGDDTLEEALSDFENNAKRKFTGDGNVIVRVTGLADDPARGVKRGKLTLTSEKMQALFEPIMSTITTLVKNQLKHTKQAKAVILVGGFGGSPYLRKTIQKVVGNVEVLQPAHGWTAVVRGALKRALNEDAPDTCRIQLALRVARKACGIRVDRPFNPHLHDTSRKCVFETFN
ncbi:hypothetical protein LTS15_000246 [Exophiala xenobiotica]|nr:hypothetical protein LTS15_000246 [Exophiala xenobiotica]